MNRMNRLTAAKIVQYVSLFFAVVMLALSFASNSYAQGPLRITTTSPLPSAIAGTSYPATTINGAGGTTPYTWTVTGLPAGLSFTIAGNDVRISGTPSNPAAVGPHTVDVTLDDPTPTPVVNVKYQLEVLAPLSITTATLPPATVGVPYVPPPLNATGGKTPYTWTIVGAKPAWLTLSSSGTISGTPTTAGTATLTVEVSDAAAAPVHQAKNTSLSITIAAAPAPPLSITSNSPLPGGTTNSPYSPQTLGATGGTAPYTWSVLTGSLPSGLTLSPSGVISGTPTSAGPSTVSIQVADAGGQTASKSFSITIAAALSITTTSPLPAGLVSATYQQTLAAAGGSAPYTWSVAAGSLPSGLTLSSSGIVNGVPSGAGTSTFTALATDSLGATASKSFTITINPPALSIDSSPPLPGLVGIGYSHQLFANGGTPPYAFNLVGGILPPGTTLSADGVLSGTPQTAGSYSLSVRVMDSSSPRQTATQNFTVVIGALLTITSSSPLSNGSVGAAYSENLTASGGSVPYTWSVTGGSLPPGLTLSAAGSLSGSPTATGDFSFTIQAVDSGGGSASKTFTITIQAGLTITTTSPLPSATVGASYSRQLQASSSISLAWTVTGGNLPPGITLSSNGLLSGTPSGAGTFDFTVQVTGGSPQQAASQSFRLAVLAGLDITTGSTPNGSTTARYTQTLDAAGGVSPYTWTLSNGALPDGLSLSSGGVISGQPTTAGTFNFTVQVSDSAGSRASKSFVITITAAPSGALSLSGLPATTTSAQQLPMGMTLSASQSTAMTGTVTMTFVPSTAIGGDDPTVRFSTGSRTASFTIAPNTVNAVFPANLLLQTGTVAGTITISASVQNGPTGVLVGNITIQPSAPQLTAISATRSTGSIRIQITGYSTERKVITAEFSFNVKNASGGATRVDLSRNVEAEFDAWYRSAASAPFGSSFLFDQTFAVQGDATLIDSVSIRLTNSQGGTASASTLIN